MPDDTSEASLLSPPIRTALTIARELLPVMTAIVGGLWVFFTYLGNQNAQEIQRQDLEKQRLVQAEAAEKQRLAQAEAAEKQQRAEARKLAQLRVLEARKPFLTRQLELYFETAQVVGRLVTEELQTPSWQSAEKRYQSLYWSEL